MLAELREIRAPAERDLPKLFHPKLGWVAGIGKYQAFYSRDPQRFITLVLPYLDNLHIPGVMDIAEQSLDMQEKLQAQEPNPLWEVDFPGKIIHEWRNGFLPTIRSEELRANGWPFFENAQNEWELRYHGAGDVTSGYIISVATLARAKEAVYSETERDQYLRRKWSSIKASYYHQIRIADAVGDGLIMDNPFNNYGLYHHTERDSDYAFDLEKAIRSQKGIRPRGPFFYFSNNVIYLSGLKETRWMAQLLGEHDLAQEAFEKYQRGREKLIELFWVPERGYPASLVFGKDRQRTDSISDEPLDGLYYEIFNREQVEQVVPYFLQAGLIDKFGVKSRSRLSEHHYVNGPKAYWSGAIWPHRTAIAAEGLEKYGFQEEADQLDHALVNMIKRKGNVELGCVDSLGRLYDYREGGRAVGCNPHLFALAAVFARSAHPRTTVVQYLEERKAKLSKAA